MKAYLKNIPVKLRNFSKILDAKTYLCDKAWVVLNDGQSKDVYIFRPDGELILTRNGVARVGRFTILPVDKILIDIDGNNYLFNPLISNGKEVLALKLDGSEQFSFLIDEGCEMYGTVKTYLDYERRLIAEEKRQIEIEDKDAKIKDAEDKQQYYAKLQLSVHSIFSDRLFLFGVIFMICFIVFIILSLDYYLGQWTIVTEIIVAFGILLMINPYILRTGKNQDKQKIEKLLSKNDISEKERRWLTEYYNQLNL